MAARDLPYAPERSVADRFVDDVVPASVDWEDVVRRHPLPSLAVAALVGYLVGRVNGPALAASVAESATRRIEAGVDRLVGQLVPALEGADAYGDDDLG